MNEREKSPKAVRSDLIDVDTVAKLLEVTGRTVRNKAATGLLQKYLVIGVFLFKESFSTSEAIGASLVVLSCLGIMLINRKKK